MPSKTFPSRDKKTGYDIDVTVEAGEGLEPYDKGTLPSDIQTKYGDETITWLCNFGVRHIKDGNKGPDLQQSDNRSYTVKLQLPSDPNNRERKICIYDPTRPEGDRVVVKEKGRSRANIVFTLNTGDPPTGIFP